MEVKLALLADGANVSREGKLNLLGIFDTLFARSFPTTHPQMQLVIRFEAAAHEAGSTRQVEIQLVAGDGNVLFRLPGALTVQPPGLGDAIRMDHVLTLNHVQFERPGRYRFDVLVDGRVAAAVPGGGGAVSASIRRRRAGCLHRPPLAAPHRRSDGAPASPLRYSAPRACRTSAAGTRERWPRALGGAPLGSALCLRQ